MREAQLLAVCEQLVRRLRKGDAYWTVNGGSPACDAVRNGKSPWSSGEQVLVKLAWVLWNGGAYLELREVVDVLGGPWLRLIGSLLVAMSTEGEDGGAAVDRWLKDNHVPGAPFVCSSCGPLYMGQKAAVSHSTQEGHVVTRTVEPLTSEGVARG